MNGSGGYRPCPKRSLAFQEVQQQYNDVFEKNKNMKINGETREYHPNGALLCNATYVDGMPVKAVSLYYPSAKVHTLAFGTGDTAAWWYYDENGKILGYCTPTIEMSRWPDGNLHFTLHRKPVSGDRHGHYEVYNEDGSLLHDEMYEDGDRKLWSSIENSN